jgi:gamma-glutamylcyclotransferase (GGCT)/AIG2-like uncharacterized protein YtfP
MMPESPKPPRYAFVYGTLRCGGSNDITRFDPKPERVADARIAGTLYHLGAYPGAVLGGTGELVGEIYRIHPDLEALLDVLEEVGPGGSGEYIKREVLVEIESGERMTCLVYEIHPARILERMVIPSGDWFRQG